jgi:hypothetical protein
VAIFRFRMRAVKRPAPARLLVAAALALLSIAVAAAPALGSSFKGFVSPTRNIGCVMDSTGVRCDIREHSWPTPPKPKSCEFDYGGGLFVGTKGKAEFICASDTALEAGPVLPYGSSKRFGRFRCTSEESGMRCVNTRNGHGFVLSKQRAKRF